MLEFREIERHNFRDILKLSTTESQKFFVATNAYSLSQAYAQPECVPLALYEGDTPVGFTMYGLDVEDTEYWIYRLMIDQRHQSKGYGRQALAMVLERIRQDKAHHRVYLSCNPDNAWGRALYESVGFRPDGRMVHGEIVHQLVWEP